MAAVSATATVGGRCAPSSAALCPPAATPPSTRASAAHPAQVSGAQAPTAAPGLGRVMSSQDRMELGAQPAVTAASGLLPLARGHEGPVQSTDASLGSVRWDICTCALCVSLCSCVCIFLCLSVYTYLCLCVSVCMRVSMLYICLCLCACVSAYVSTCHRMHVSLYLCACPCVSSVCMSVCMCVCLSVLQVFVCLCVCMCLCVQRSPPQCLSSSEDPCPQLPLPTEDTAMQTPELLAPSLCPAPGGEYFVEGETWSLDSCTQCTCHSGRVLCGTEVCPPLLCHNPVRTQDSCCPQCPGTT